MDRGILNSNQPAPGIIYGHGSSTGHIGYDDASTNVTFKTWYQNARYFIFNAMSFNPILQVSLCKKKKGFASHTFGKKTMQNALWVFVFVFRKWVMQNARIFFFIVPPLFFFSWRLKKSQNLSLGQDFIFKESESYHSPTLSLTSSWPSDLSLPYITPHFHGSLL